MPKTFKYRLCPTGKQARLLQQTLNECRWLYNHLLEQRKTARAERQQSLNYRAQQNTLPELKRQRPALKAVYSQVLQNVAVRIDLACKAFFRRLKAGEKPGYPRFRGAHRYDSFCYPQSGFKLEKNRLALSKIGSIKLVLHRVVKGTIKTCCIRRTSTGKWFVALSCATTEQPLRQSKAAVGIDVGLESFATFSDGTAIANPRFFRQDQQALGKVQRKLAQAAKGTTARAQRRLAVAHVHEHIANRRQDFAHQAARRIVNQFGTICIEDLSVNRMVHNHCLSKSIHDAAWSQFAHYLSYKAAEAGRILVRVNPAYTTQDCSRCEHRQKLALDCRWFDCPHCGLSLHRDHNAALNILRLGLQSPGPALEAPALAGE